MSYSLKVSEEAKEKIRPVIAYMERHFQKLESAHQLREIMKVESDVPKLYYPTLPKYSSLN
jgi:hypothetical protein